MPWWTRWKNAFRSAKLDDDIHAELQAHLDEARRGVTSIGSGVHLGRP